MSKLLAGWDYCEIENDYTCTFKVLAAFYMLLIKESSEFGALLTITCLIPSVSEGGVTIPFDTLEQAVTAANAIMAGREGSQ